MQTDAHRAGFEVAAADNQHGVDAQLFRVLNLSLDRIVAEVGAHADHLPAQFTGDVLGVFHERGGRAIVFRADGDDTHLVQREPERKVVGVMFDQEANETFVYAERRDQRPATLLTNALRGANAFACQGIAPFCAARPS